MNKEEIKSSLQKIVDLKKQLLTIRIKISSGEVHLAKEVKKIKKDIAKTFTNINRKENKQN
jgi:ribosomal protein L29